MGSILPRHRSAKLIHQIQYFDSDELIYRIKTAEKWVTSLAKNKNVLIYEPLYTYLIKTSSRYKLKGTPMRI